jgi:hypothetical protein
MSNAEVAVNQEKKNELHKRSNELITNTILLKPFYKKYIILRQNELINHYFKISKNRKSFNNKADGIESSLKFDYIISTVDNPFELKNTKEDNYIYQEVITIMQTYLTKVMDMNEGKNILMMYLSKYISLNNNVLIAIINDLLHRVSHFEFQLDLKLIYCDKFLEIATGVNNIRDIVIINEEEIVGFLFKITNKVNKTEINILQLSYDDQIRFQAIATKFNEINMTKKKRNLSSKKKKGGKDITYILDEIAFEDLYYFSTFLDISNDENSIESVKEVLFNIN